MNDSSGSKNEKGQVVMQPYYGQAPYEEDEINLIDLWMLLISYKNRFLTVFIPITILVILYNVFFYKESYELTTSIQIGSYITETGSQPLESPESLLPKVNNSIEPNFTKNWKLKKEYQSFVKTDISNPKGSNVIIIKNKIAKDDVETFEDYQLELAKSVIIDHQKIIVSLQANLLNNLERSKLKLGELENPLFLKIKLKALEISLDAEKIKSKKLKDPQFFGIKKNQFKNSIAASINTLKALKGQADVTNKKLANLDYSKKIIKKNIDGLQELIVVAHKNKKRSLSKATELNAMSLLLIDNEIQQNQNRLLTLEERYYVGIENERSVLQESLDTNLTQQIEQQNNISILEEKYKEMILDNSLQVAQQQLAVDKILLSIEKTKFNTNNDILKQKQSVNKLKTQLDNYNKTRVVSNPSISQKPIGLSQKMMIILMVFLSGFIAFISVLVAIFADKVKQRRLELESSC